jgi:hypothetical protein
MEIWLQHEVVLFAFGVVFALPFIGMKLYAARVSLSVIVALLAHGAANWDYGHALSVIMGALCAAHVRTLWSFFHSRNHVR